MGIKPSRFLERPLGHNLARPVFMAALLANFAGLTFTVGGLSSLQAYCEDHDGVVSGESARMKPAYATGAQMEFNLGGFWCSRFWRYEWWGWVLQICVLAVTAAIYYAGLAPCSPCRAEASSSRADGSRPRRPAAPPQYYITEGIMKTRGIITFVGFALCAGSNYVLMFAGCALIEERHHQAKMLAAAGTNGANGTAVKGTATDGVGASDVAQAV
eukprot:scaffold9.g3006.t1